MTTQQPDWAEDQPRYDREKRWIELLQIAERKYQEAYKKGYEDGMAKAMQISEEFKVNVLNPKQL